MTPADYCAAKIRAKLTEMVEEAERDGLTSNQRGHFVFGVITGALVAAHISKNQALITGARQVMAEFTGEELE